LPAVKYRVDPSAGEIRCCAFSSDGQYFAVGGDDGIARMWKVVDQGEAIPPATQFVGHEDRIQDVVFIEDTRPAKDGSPLPPLRLLTGSRDKTARVWDPPEPRQAEMNQKKVGRELVSLRRHIKGVTAVDSSRDGSLVVTAGSDGAVILWPANIDPPPKKKNPFELLEAAGRDR
jgi:WD40 repeat protein